MRIIAVGDTHGRNNWKEISLHETYNKFIFMGDYFDNANITVESQSNNFLDILEFKKTHPDKVVLIFGNHDLHYLYGVDEYYSGYQWHGAVGIRYLINDAYENKIYKMCYTYENYVFTHAGITKTWAKNNFDFDLNIQNVEDSLNDLFYHKPKLFGFTRGEFNSSTGNEVTQTPIWVRKEALLFDKIADFRYVVGHSTVTDLIIDKDIIMTDCIELVKNI